MATLRRWKMTKTTWVAVRNTRDANLKINRKRVYFNTKEEAIKYTHQQRKHAREHWEVYSEQYE